MNDLLFVHIFKDFLLQSTTAAIFTLYADLHSNEIIRYFQNCCKVNLLQGKADLDYAAKSRFNVKNMRKKGKITGQKMENQQLYINLYKNFAAK